jgi:hypothetical protein
MESAFTEYLGYVGREITITSKSKPKAIIKAGEEEGVIVLSKPIFRNYEAIWIFSEIMQIKINIGERILKNLCNSDAGFALSLSFEIPFKTVVENMICNIIIYKYGDDSLNMCTLY